MVQYGFFAYAKYNKINYTAIYIALLFILYKIILRCSIFCKNKVVTGLNGL